MSKRDSPLDSPLVTRSRARTKNHPNNTPDCNSPPIGNTNEEKKTDLKTKGKGRAKKQKGGYKVKDTVKPVFSTTTYSESTELLEMEALKDHMNFLHKKSETNIKELLD